MIDKLKKINMNRICIIFILIQPIIDMITSILVRNVSSVFTIGIFIRAIFMVFVVLYSLIISNSNDRKKIFIYYVKYRNVWYIHNT